MMASPLSSDPGDETWQAIELFWDDINIDASPDVFQLEFERLPKSIGHLFAVWWCDSEVCNGGFQQFFFNSTGILAPEALAGFRAIGRPDLAEILIEAMERFGADFPRDREMRQTRLSELKRPGKSREEWDPFYLLDEQYFAAKEKPNLFLATDRFARENAS